MTEFYHAVLDDFPDDAAARLLFAEHLAERGDPDAAGYRWMAERAKRPFRLSCWWSWSVNTHGYRSEVPAELFLAMVQPKRRTGYPTRRAAEKALCEALS